MRPSLLPATLVDFAPFLVDLAGFQGFRHSKKSATAWLDPSSQEGAWAHLHLSCQAAFPHCTDQGARGPFTPHLTVGQPAGPAALQALLDLLNSAWSPVSTMCGTLFLISRPGPDDPFDVHWTVPLGGHGKPLQAHIPVLTTPCTPERQGAPSARPTRVTLCSAADRSVQCVGILPSPHVDTGVLARLAKNKLRLPGRASALTFSRPGGELLGSDSTVAQGSTILVAPLEPCLRAPATGAATMASVEPKPTSLPGYPRQWLGTPGSPGSFRLLSWNILATGLARGTDGAAIDGSVQSHPGGPCQSTQAPSTSPCSVATPQQEEDLWLGSRPWFGTHIKKPASNVFLCPQADVSWHVRGPLVANELLRHSPAMLALQEVSPDQMAWLGALLEPRGFACACTLGGSRSHGEALFWDTALLTASGPSEVHQLGGGKTLLTQPLVAVQGNRSTPPASLLLATTHMKAGLCRPAEKVRTGQAASVVRALETAAPVASEFAIILAGDLNSLPCPLLIDNDGERLDPYALPRLLAGGLRNAHTDLGPHAAPRYTTWAGWQDREVRAVLDYVLIWGNISASAALQEPSCASVLSSPCRLPNKDFPSDHIPLVIDLGLKKCTGTPTDNIRSSPVSGFKKKPGSGPGTKAKNRKRVQSGSVYS
eukprot:gene11814-324_t